MLAFDFVNICFFYFLCFSFCAFNCFIYLLNLSKISFLRWWVFRSLLFILFCQYMTYAFQATNFPLKTASALSCNIDISSFDKTHFRIILICIVIYFLIRRLFSILFHLKTSGGFLSYPFSLIYCLTPLSENTLCIISNL